MQKMKYPKRFIGTVIIMILLMLALIFFSVYSIISIIQYNELTQNMTEVEATVTDISTYYRVRSRRFLKKQEIQIAYTVDGKTYERELDTDTSFSFDAGTNTNFRVGDVISILCDPDDPGRIATELTIVQGLKVLRFGVIGALFTGAVSILIIANRKKHLITEEKYEKEKAQKKAKRKKYSDFNGDVIRAQYFNGFLFAVLCIFIFTFSLIGFNTLLDGEGTKYESFSEVICTAATCIILTSPVLILSLLNRKFFGTVICLMNEEGIRYKEKLIKWDKITEIKYGLFSSVVMGENIEIEIERAPFLILQKARHYSRTVKAYVSGKTVCIFIGIIVCLVGCAFLLTIK